MTDWHRYDWDGWRARYDEMTFADMVESYREIAELYPEQRCFDRRSVRGFLNQSQATVIDEIGGWDGALAERMMAERPRGMLWVNHDLVKVPSAVGEKHYGYMLNVLTDWPWRRRYYGQALVLSHVVEHLSLAHLRELLTVIKHEWVYVDAPLPLTGTPEWTGYAGTHILPLSMEELNREFMAAGYSCVYGKPTEHGHARHFRRSSK